MNAKRAAIVAAIMTIALVPTMLIPAAASAAPPGSAPPPVAEELAAGLTGPIGSVIGPDGALYVADRAGGRIVRVDTGSGAMSNFATGFPVTGPGGVFDVTFIGDSAYALVSVVGPEVGGNSIGGIFRIDDATHRTMIADTDTWSRENPPDTDYFVPSGLQYAFVPYQGGFLVSDGHHNRLLFAGLDGSVREVAQYANIVPTGLQLDGSKLYVAEAGPVPYNPADGRVVAVNVNNPVERTVAVGYSLVVDVEAASCGLYALSQGDSPGMVEPGSPGLPNSGELLRVNGNGTFTPIVTGLDLPTSLSFAGETAYIVTLGGDVLTVDNVAGDRHGTWGGCGGMGPG
ncbi:ScyD/ScyE family protein [Microbacterium sp. B2969]|uniref:ScyD/ScyE family protein n=1 Tax=Microbacterium alkaliflavum TaxID=3248839 RepID=A0ABW7Q1V2_9MICO